MNSPEESLSLDDVCVLITETERRGEYGEKESERSEREIFCRRRSIGQNEFFKARQEGLRSDICLLAVFEEYAGENAAAYDGREYLIYRTYEREDGLMELYLSERAGVSDDL